MEELIEEAGLLLTPEQAADRVLVVVCALTGGDTRVSVSKATVIAECQRLRILEMSESEFDNYLISVGHAMDAKQN